VRISDRRQFFEPGPQAAFELLTPDRQIMLLQAALGICLKKGISGYQAGAFVVGSLIKPESRCSFWESFSPQEVALR